MRKRVVVFGIFDGVHEGHRDFFRQALRPFDFAQGSGQAKEEVELIVIVGRDSASLKLKNKKPRYSEKERLSMVSRESSVNHAVLGDEEQSTYNVLEKLNPDIICFGYDQDTLWHDLEKWKKSPSGGSPAGRKNIQFVRLQKFDR